MACSKRGFLLLLAANVFVGSCTHALQTIDAGTDDELRAETWNRRAQETVSSHVRDTWGGAGPARSAVLAVGGGMSLHTLRASRAFLGQADKKETPLHFENFPVVGMVKTYCVDAQIGDDACTATAYLGGVKGRAGVVGASATGAVSKCGIPDDFEAERYGTIVEWALDAGKSVGIVTTSSVTHASVAGSYGRTSLSSWESDSDVIRNGLDPAECPDLAYQLINSYPGNRFKVILGGGRDNFLPNSTKTHGKRKDKRNLIADWTNEKINKKIKSQYVSTREELKKINQSTGYLLGIFSPDHMDYHVDADSSQPTLEEMTEAAIKVLSKDKNGYFLFIFGGRINDAHNENKARIAVDETIELAKAVQKVSELTNPSDTLTLVTADHAHTMTLSGYPSRWNDIFGEVHAADDDKMADSYPYLSINYANGPGFRQRNLEGLRINVAKEAKFLNYDSSFQFPAVFPLHSGSSGGEDVAIFARGPSHHLFTGVMEQHLIPHIMAYSMCIGPGVTACRNTSAIVNSPSAVKSSSTISSASSIISTLSLFLCLLRNYLVLFD